MTRLLSLAALAPALLFVGSAAAQPAQPETPTPFGPAEDPAATGQAPVDPPATPEPPPPAPAPHAPPHGAAHGHGDMAAHHGMMHGPKRPDDPTVGLGFGYAFPTSFETPNVTSARFRLASGLTLEPRVVLATSSTTVDNGVDESTTSQVEVSLGGNVRFPLASRGRIDLVGVGGAALSFQQVNPEGDDNTARTTALGVAWGLGLDFWLRHNWSLSMTATNPLFTYTKQSEEQVIGDDTSTSNFSIGAVFDPQLDLMLHLFF